MKTQTSPTATTPQPAKKKMRPFSKSPKVWLMPALIGVVMVAAVAVLWMMLYKPQIVTTNRAEEVAKPLEEGVAKAGGVKKSGGGDPGHGPDNLEPYYDAIYEVPVGKEQAITLANKVAEENGYKLVHASPTNRGHLGAVADIYIDAWYFDNTSKQSTFSDLNTGPIRLAFKVGDEDHPDGLNKTTLRISIRMPNVRS